MTLTNHISARRRRIRPRHRTALARRGVLTVELMLTLPILLLVVLATIEFGILLVSTQAVNAAAAVGAREATLPSATPESVAAAVEKALHGWKFLSSLDPIKIEVNGEPEATIPLADATTGDSVAVTVCVNSAAAAPNLLKFIGLTLDGQKTCSTIVMRKE
jgi:Flp pilus assembly protein TadG